MSKPLSPANRVFNIYEVLEMILIDAPFMDLVRHKFINRSFRAVIETYCPLQKTLFYNPSPKTCLPNTRTWNPFLSQICGAKLHGVEIPVEDRMGIRILISKLRLNRAVTASWRKTHYINPTASTVTIEVHGWWRDVYCEAGVTMGQVADTLQGLLVWQYLGEFAEKMVCTLSVHQDDSGKYCKHYINEL